MSRHVATVPLTFQRFPIIPGTSPRHERDIDAPVQPNRGLRMTVLKLRNAAELACRRFRHPGYDCLKIY